MNKISNFDIISNNVILDSYDSKFEYLINKYCKPNMCDYEIYNRIINFTNSNKFNNININLKNINIKLFNFKIKNLKWMKYVEKNYNSSIYSFQDLTKCYFVKFKGGCLIDDSGTGKTTTLISYLIINHLLGKKNLIICTIKTVNKITQILNNNQKSYNLLTIEKFNFDFNNDFIIVPICVLEKNNKILNILMNISWERIIVDNIYNLNMNINCLKSKYKWCSSSLYFL